MIQQSTMNAIWNCSNPNQGTFKRVLTVCSAGLLRSPTIASVLIERGYNARACGIHDYALVPISDALITWADYILFADQEHYNLLKGDLPQELKVYVLNIPDMYKYRDPKLLEIVREKLDEKGFK